MVAEAQEDVELNDKIDPDEKGSLPALSKKLHKNDSQLQLSIKGILYVRWIFFWTKFFRANSRVRRNWKKLVSVIILYNCVVIPFRMVFADSHDYALIVWTFLDVFADLIFVADLVSHFFVPFVNNGLVVTSLDKVRRNYLHGWFWIDCLAVFPLDYFFWSNLTHNGLRVFRILKLARLKGYTDDGERYTSYPQVIKLLKVVFLVGLLSHWASCLYYLIAKSEGFPDHAWFLFPNDQLRKATTANAYLMSFYWSFTAMTGLGSDPQLPETKLEILFTILIAMVGVTILATVVGNMWTLISSMNESQEEFRKTMDIINVFMRKRKVPRALRKRIRQHYEYVMSRNGMDDNVILSGLPDHLRFDVSLFLNRNIISKVPFFEGCNPGFIKRLAIHLKPQLFSPNEWIIRYGEIGDEMYFISKGKVQASLPDGTELSILKSGSFFGEIALLFRCKRTASVQALKFTHVFILKKKVLDKVLMEYPQYIPKMQAIAQERLLAENIEDSTYLKVQSKSLLKKRDMELFDTYQKKQKVTTTYTMTTRSPEDLRRSILKGSGEDLLGENYASAVRLLDENTQSVDGSSNQSTNREWLDGMQSYIKNDLSRASKQDIIALKKQLSASLATVSSVLEGDSPRPKEPVITPSQQLRKASSAFLERVPELYDDSSSSDSDSDEY